MLCPQSFDIVGFLLGMVITLKYLDGHRALWRLCSKTAECVGGDDMQDIVPAEGFKKNLDLGMDHTVFGNGTIVITDNMFDMQGFVMGYLYHLISR